MIASLDMALILNKAHEFGEFILQSEEVKHYQECKLRLEANSIAQALIKDFKRKKAAFEEAERFGKYHPDYKRLNQEMREAKRTMDSHEDVARFKKTERDLENIFNEISKVLALSLIHI